MTDPVHDPRRRLPLEGTDNVRDLGGYPTADGRLTRWGRFLRADSLHRLTPSTQQDLRDWGLRTVVDLRRDGELAAAPNPFAGAVGVAYHQVDMVGEAGVGKAGVDPAQPLDDRTDEIAANYRLWLEARQGPVRTVLTTLAAADALPALFHCAAGKDRTGVVAALLLGLAGVAAPTIVEDYSLTARHLVARYRDEQRALGRDLGDYDWEDYQEQYAPRQAMRRVLRHLDGRYGGVAAYVRAIGVTEAEVARLRQGLLEGSPRQA